jgi:hypothetical protein
MKAIRCKLSCLLLVAIATVAQAAETPVLKPLIDSLMSEEAELRGVPFGDVIHAATGKRVLPVNTEDAATKDFLAKMSATLDRVLAAMNAPDSPAHSERRINEVSSHFEKALLTALNEVPGFACEYPKTAAGRVQRSGYPDLRLMEQGSGRVIYLDPKLFDAKSRSSTLRTFYYEPKRETNKVLEDAHHLLIGFAHGGKVDGRWRFQGWELVDLSRFRVRLKAEFQGSNRDLYQNGAILGTGQAKE